jgi:hypothetical protein
MPVERDAHGRIRKRTFTPEERERLLDNLQRGRETRAANRAMRQAEAEAAKNAPPPPPPIPLTETDEFRAALAAAMDAAKKEILAETAQYLAARVAHTDAANGAVDSLKPLLTQLTLTMTDVADQGTGRIRVAPEVLAERRKADGLMRQRIADTYAEVRRLMEAGHDDRAEALVPRYRLVGKIFAALNDEGGGGEIIEPYRRGGDNRVYPTELGSFEVPSLAMVPINDTASAIFALFKESIGNQSSTRVVGVFGEGVNADVRFANGPDAHVVTTNGRVNSAGADPGALSASAAKFLVDTPEFAPKRKALPRMQIIGVEAGRVQQNGPPTKQVRVLGTVAPPAVQNG